MARKKIVVTVTDGHYYAPIDDLISVREWRNMLRDEKIFPKNCLEIIEKWYHEPNCLSTSVFIINKYRIKGKTHFNGEIVGLGKRIIKYLDKYEFIDPSGNNYFITTFEGWRSSSGFVWKLHKNLIEAINELQIFDNGVDEIENVVEIKAKADGKKLQYYVTKYERNPYNRLKAIELHGYVCAVCKFDFFETYGEIGKEFIEVHHNQPLYKLDEPMDINPETDLDCVCSNCHRMLHKGANGVLTVTELQAIMQNQKK